MDDVKNWLPVGTYNAVRVSKYGNTYSVVSGSRGDNDTYEKWCNPLKYSNGRKVPVLKRDGDLLVLPFQFPLGNDKAKAMEILKALIWQVEQL